MPSDLPEWYEGTDSRRYNPNHLNRIVSASTIVPISVGIGGFAAWLKLRSYIVEEAEYGMTDSSMMEAIGRPSISKEALEAKLATFDLGAMTGILMGVLLIKYALTRSAVKYAQKYTRGR